MKFQSSCNCNRLHSHVIDPMSVIGVSSDITTDLKFAFFAVEYMLNQSILFQSISRDLIIKDEMGRPLPAIVVFKLSIQYLSQDLFEVCSRSLKGGLTMNDIRWVLTVPAIWSDGAKQFMREAAEKVIVPVTEN